MTRRIVLELGETTTRRTVGTVRSPCERPGSAPVQPVPRRDREPKEG